MSREPDRGVLVLDNFQGSATDPAASSFGTPIGGFNSLTMNREM